MCVLYRSLYYYKSEAVTGCTGQPTLSPFENKSVGEYKVWKYIVNWNHKNKSSYKNHSLTTGCLQGYFKRKRLLKNRENELKSKQNYN